MVLRDKLQGGGSELPTRIISQSSHTVRKAVALSRRTEQDEICARHPPQGLPPGEKPNSPPPLPPFQQAGSGDLEHCRLHREWGLAGKPASSQEHLSAPGSLAANHNGPAREPGTCKGRLGLDPQPPPGVAFALSAWSKLPGLWVPGCSLASRAKLAWGGEGGML